MKISRKEFFESSGIDPKTSYERLYGADPKKSFEDFLSGDICDTIQVAKHEVRAPSLVDPEEPVPYSLRIGADITPVGWRHHMPIKEEDMEKTVEGVIDEYVVSFGLEEFAERLNLSMKEKEELKSKLAGVQQKLKSNANLAFEVAYTPMEIQLKKGARDYVSYRVGVVKDENGRPATEDGKLLFLEENLLDIVMKEVGKGGQ